LNGYFTSNSVFTPISPIWLSLTMRLSKNNCVETSKDRHILSAAQIFGKEGSIVSANIKFVRIFIRVLEKDGIKGQLGCALLLI